VRCVQIRLLTYLLFILSPGGWRHFFNWCEFTSGQTILCDRNSHVIVVVASSLVTSLFMVTVCLCQDEPSSLASSIYIDPTSTTPASTPVDMPPTVPVDCDVGQPAVRWRACIARPMSLSPLTPRCDSISCLIIINIIIIIASAVTRRHLRSINHQYLAIVSTLTAAMSFQSPALELSLLFDPGQDHQCRIVVDDYLKHICSLDTGAFSALEVLDDYCTIWIYLLACIFCNYS